MYFRNNEVISQESLTNAKILVLPGPLSKFTELEMNSIRTFLNSGGNILVTLGEGGENKSNTNINFLLEEFGIMVNNGKIFRQNNSLSSSLCLSLSLPLSLSSSLCLSLSF